jgi:hypothetical protein
MCVRHAQLLEQVATVDELSADEVRDRHLSVVRLALNTTFRHEQPRPNQRRPVARADIRVDDQIRHAELVLDGDEDDAVGGSRTLPHQDDAEQPDGGARACHVEPPCVVVSLRSQSGPQQFERVLSQCEPGRGAIHHDRLARGFVGQGRERFQDQRRLLSQKRDGNGAAALLGSGKLVELAALTGYANARNSSLIGDQIDSRFLVEEKLFANQDTTIGIVQPESQALRSSPISSALSKSHCCIAWSPRFAPPWRMRWRHRCFWSPSTVGSKSIRIYVPRHTQKMLRSSSWPQRRCTTMD